MNNYYNQTEENIYVQATFLVAVKKKYKYVSNQTGKFTNLRAPTWVFAESYQIGTERVRITPRILEEERAEY